MRWVDGGPDLPEELLQRLEDGRLVLFCGAGVSRSAGLPGFRGLIEQVYEKTNEKMRELEQEEFDRLNFDRVLGLLETRIGAQHVRRPVIDILRLEQNANLATHRSLLDLATTSEGVCRLVTTNFDRGFEIAGATNIDTAPKLPVPKTDTWNSVVHLHGRICDSDPDGRCLVMTSADFGRAYLTEGWASRFLSELFRRSSVLFIGYSAEDPVVRYMLDAFEAERAPNEDIGIYALVGCSAGNDDKEDRAWKAKNVTPLLYDNQDDHAALHETISRWAACHRRGLLGKESIVQEHGGKSPTRPFDKDPLVSQVVWALREESGRVAHVFARLDPAPPVEWLDAFEEEGLLSLPSAPSAAHGQGSWGPPLVGASPQTTLHPRLNPISRALGEWLSRHLDKPEVLDWVLRSGSVLHTEFRTIIRQRLAKTPSMPAALRQLWKVLTSESVVIRTNIHDSGFIDVLKQLKSGEWDIQLRQDVIYALSPVLELQPSIHSGPRDDEAISHFADVEVVPRSRDAQLLINAISESPKNQQILSDLADDATSLLKAAMLLFEMVQKAGPFWDWSYFDQPSISQHSQNSGLSDWTVLLELCRDAWLALRDTNLLDARRLVERWRTLRFPVFRRLCFFAMSESDLYSPEECLAYLLEDDGWWLWSICVYREKFRLVDSIWPKLGSDAAAELVARIVSGPPRSMFRDDLSNEEFGGIVDRQVWLHLSKLKKAGGFLPESGDAKLSELCARYPEWRLEDEDRSEFPTWAGHAIGETPVEKQDEFVNLTDDAVLRRLRAREISKEDLVRWQHLLDVDPQRASALLAQMAEKDSWKAEIWHNTLESLGNQKRIVPQWEMLAPHLATAPDFLLEEVCEPLAWCLKEVAAASEAPKPPFWKVWDRLQQHAFRDATEEVSDMLTAALNAPEGHLTQALVDFVANGRPQRASDLPDDVWKRLTSLVTGHGQPFRKARILLASRLAWFHSLNSEWVETHFLPYFDWSRSQEAPGVWEGFLWQAKVTPALWPHIKTHLLATLRKRQQLGERAYEQVCRLFGLICVNRPEWLTIEEIQEALRSLDCKGRALVARIFWNRMQGAGDQSETLWNDLIGPRLKCVWPKDRDMLDPESSLNLPIAATYAGASFRDAVDVILPLLVPTKHHALLWKRVLEVGIAEREPEATLKLAGAIVDTKAPLQDSNLREALKVIQAADASAANQPVFRKLDEHLRHHNR